MLKKFSASIVFVYIVYKVVYDGAHKQAQRGEIAANRYVSEPQKCTKKRLRPGGTPLGKLTAIPRPIAGNGGGPPGRERENERRGGEGWGWEGWEKK